MPWQPGVGIFPKTTSAASVKTSLMAHAQVANTLATSAVSCRENVAIISTCIAYQNGSNKIPQRGNVQCVGRNSNGTGTINLLFRQKNHPSLTRATLGMDRLLHTQRTTTPAGLKRRIHPHAAARTCGWRDPNIHRYHGKRMNTDTWTHTGFLQGRCSHLLPVVDQNQIKST